MVSKKVTGFLPLVWGLFLWLLVLPFQAVGIWGGDSGDLVTAAWLGGVPHPPGYPLYTLAGLLVSHLPVFSPAWRMALLSSIPHAAAATVVMLLVWQMSGMVVAGMFASLVLVGNYLFFLYSVTPEVFALLDFFVVMLVYLCYRWTVTKRLQYLYLLGFMAGLSLTHHQLVLFVFPAIGYWLWRGPTLGKNASRACFGYFILG
ncbi:DUF2723 domain-containing protein, partial [Candidatus Gottesmanbacteria bacterium]|nr:DUF2723 domain-containing protein [Candidatus Gottesmanbacteria bacterium]